MSTASETVELNRFSEAFGYPKDSVVGKLKPYLTRYVQEFVKQAPFVVMATSDAAGNCDASPKGGKPGFVRVLDDNHLLFPDVAGNKLFQSYQNVEANPHVGPPVYHPRHERDGPGQRKGDDYRQGGVGPAQRRPVLV